MDPTATDSGVLRGRVEGVLAHHPRIRQSLVPILREVGEAGEGVDGLVAGHLGVSEGDVKEVRERLGQYQGPEYDEGCPALVGFPFIGLTPQLCVRCERCVEACAASQKKAVMRVSPGRLRPVNSLSGDSWPASGCTFCGACVDACPTGALVGRGEALIESMTYRPQTVCSLCDEGCELLVQVRDRKVVSTAMPEPREIYRLCAVGRFGYAKVLNHPERLTMPQVRREGELEEAEWEEALRKIAAELKRYAKGEAVVVIGRRQTIENEIVYDQFARRVLHGQVLSTSGVTRAAGLELLKMEMKSGRVKAAVVAGDLLDSEALAYLEYLVVLDFLPSKATAVADAVLPVAVLAEREGTISTRSGAVARVRKVAEPPGQARAEWTILSELAVQMGASLSSGEPNRPLMRCTDGGAQRPRPRERLADLPQTFRGHRLDQVVPALRWLNERNLS